MFPVIVAGWSVADAGGGPALYVRRTETVGAQVHTRGRETDDGCVGWVGRIDDIVVDTTHQALRTDGSVPPPTVHFLLDGLDPPYVGYLTSRPMYRGEDAAQAVRAMGLVGSLLGTARLVVTFENADLCTALELSGAAEAGPGVAVIDADRDGHEMRWRPVLLQPGPPDAARHTRGGERGAGDGNRTRLVS